MNVIGPEHSGLEMASPAPAHGNEGQNSVGTAVPIPSAAISLLIMVDVRKFNVIMLLQLNTCLYFHRPHVHISHWTRAHLRIKSCNGWGGSRPLYAFPIGR